MKLTASALHPRRLPLMLALAVVLMLPASAFADAIHGPAGDPSAGSPKSTEFMHARYYSSDFGRFLSMDPVGGQVGSSQSWNRYTYALNNPMTFVDPYGETVSLATLDDEQRDKLIQGLNEFTGNTYGVDGQDNLTLVELGEENRSQTATDFLGELIDSNDVFEVAGKRGDNRWNETTKQVEINFSSFDNVDYGDVSSQTFNYGSTLVHELFHGASGFHDLDYEHDPPVFRQSSFDWTGPVVDFVNQIRRERCLPLRASYLAERGGRIRFNHVLPGNSGKIFRVRR